MVKRILSLIVIFCFFLTSLYPYPQAHADTILGLPAPGVMVSLTPAYVPVIIKGLRVHPENPILFDFIVDTGNSGLRMSNPQLKIESEKLIKYFLASLTIPEDDLWVNLSPYEKNRIIPDPLGQTEMGRDMLAQDYILKQLTASLIYPEKNLGKEFWNRVYAKAQQSYGSTQIPVNTFNKVWIVADKAKVYVHDNTAFVVASHLKVMLEEDYLALSRHVITASSTHSVASQVIRSIVLPELEKEVNQGKNFANLRQIFYSMILAAWYKKNLKEALLNQVYSNKSKINGIARVIPAKAGIQNQDLSPEQIYRQYIKAYKKGVFNYIKEDIQNGQTVPRKYFSGGLAINAEKVTATVGFDDPAVRRFTVDGAMLDIQAETHEVNQRVSDAAMKTPMEDDLPRITKQLIEAHPENSWLDDFDVIERIRVWVSGGFLAKTEAVDGIYTTLIGSGFDTTKKTIESMLTSIEATLNVRPSVAKPSAVLQALHDGYQDLADAIKRNPDEKKMVSDEFIRPTVLMDAKEKAVGRIEEGDSVITFNFRRDRTRQLTRAFVSAVKDFTYFAIKNLGLTWITMMQDEKGVVPDDQVAFPPIMSDVTLGKYLSDQGLAQFRIAESEKYPHVTFFFNGGEENAFPGEDRVNIPSPKVQTYDEQPEMSAQQVTDRLIEEMNKLKHSFYLVNYANPDMVGHTGNLEAAKKAVEQIDKNLGELLKEAQALGINVLITADHGNIEQEWNKVDNVPHTQHTTNLVPFIFVQPDGQQKEGKVTVKQGGSLTDIAPTVLETLGLAIPAKMTGKSLLEGYNPVGIENPRTLLVILDGFGINPDREDESDAIRLAHTPVLDHLMNLHPRTELEASGLAVGVPRGQMGNSEVGHGTIGAGYVLDQPQTRVDRAIEDGFLFENPALLKAVMNAKKNGKALHLIGLVSDGGVHSSMEHIYALLELAKRHGLEKVYVHAILDGRDTTPQSAEKYLIALEEKMDELGIGQLVDFVGRFYAMDRDKRWERTEVAYDLYVDGKAEATWGDSKKATKIEMSSLGKKSVRDFPEGYWKGKTVVVREGYDVTLNKRGDLENQNDPRIIESLSTINYLTSQGAKVVLMAHLGRPEEEIEKFLKETPGMTEALAREIIFTRMSLKPVAQRLRELLGNQFKPFNPEYRTFSNAKAYIENDLMPGEVMLLENLRFNKGEEKNDPEFAKELLLGADAYVNDAPSANHRAHASIVGAPAGIPRVMGDLTKKEMEILNEVRENATSAVVGGSKVSGKIGMIKNFLLAKPERVIRIGGAMANAFLKADGINIQKSVGAEDKDVDIARALLKEFNQGPDHRVIVPHDVVVVDDFKNPTQSEIINFKKGEVVPENWTIVDIGPETTEEYAKHINRDTFWNGPMGAYDKLPGFASDGTRGIARAIALKNAVVGGGDSVVAWNQDSILSPELRAASQAKVLTGGGASLESLEGNSLPGFEALSDAAMVAEEIMAGIYNLTLLPAGVSVERLNILGEFYKDHPVPVTLIAFLAVAWDTKSIVHENSLESGAAKKALMGIYYSLNELKRTEMKYSYLAVWSHESERIPPIVQQWGYVAQNRSHFSIISTRIAQESREHVVKPGQNYIVDAAMKDPGADKVTAITPDGGIDLNARNMSMDVRGEKIDLHFDKAMAAQFEQGDFSGVRAVIINISRIPNVMPLLGLKEDDRPSRVINS